MGTASGIRTRRYHTLLTTATAPPAGRVALVVGVEAWLETGTEPVFLSSQRYAPDVVHPDGHRRIVRFEPEPWPTWTLRVDEDHTVCHEIVCHRPSGEVCLSWELAGPRAHALCVRPLLAARDYHALMRENGAFRFDACVVGANVSWQPYGDRPAVSALSNGRYEHAPSWYRNFSYEQERERGLDHIEDLGSPGVFRFELSGARRRAVIVFRAGNAPYGDAVTVAGDHLERERTRRADPIGRAVESYLVRRGDGLTVVAGYPWFTDWGRDTFIAIRGLCFATGRLGEAQRVLSAWADAVTEGMVPNRFTDGGEDPELNAVDASLWFVLTIGELLDRVDHSDVERRRLYDVVEAILSRYTAGARYGIRADEDGLIAAGQPGVQLTWMDAKVGDHVITPRIGKPVEVQALWVNALAVGQRFDDRFGHLRERAVQSFRARFPNGRGALFDVVDADHEPGKNDPAFRPNQIFAVGGLPVALIEGDDARAIVDEVERRLWTPMGLRSLDPDDPAYRSQYRGGVLERDGSYHQGTVWPWLAGPFIEAWLRVRGSAAEARAEARRRFVEPLMRQLETTGLGHVSEIADADSPHTPRGAPFQAWSLGELLRARSLVGEEN